jgi:uncharacterized protein YigE (DUF2233 family)
MGSMLRRLLPSFCLILLIAAQEGCAPQPIVPTHATSQPARATETVTHVSATTTEEPTTPTATKEPTPTATPTITSTPAPWDQLAPGIEERWVPVDPDAPEQVVYALRIEPARVTFRIHYEEGSAQTIEEWQASTGAAVIVNGGFFSGNYTPVGRIVMDGVMYGFPLNYGERSIGVAGLFTVLDGEVEMYAIGRSSYSPRGMRFDQAIESYPILLLPGRQPTYPEETNEEARRTLIGIDDQQRVIILVSNVQFTLHELSGWLAESDLNLDTALNLDGGRSTGLSVNVPGHSSLFPAYVPLPIVIAVYPE